MHLYDDFRQFEGEQFPDRPVQLVSPLSSWHRSLEDGLNSKGINEYLILNYGIFILTNKRPKV